MIKNYYYGFVKGYKAHLFIKKKLHLWVWYWLWRNIYWCCSFNICPEFLSRYFTQKLALFLKWMLKMLFSVGILLKKSIYILLLCILILQKTFVFFVMIDMVLSKLFALGLQIQLYSCIIWLHLKFLLFYFIYSSNL